MVYAGNLNFNMSLIDDSSTGLILLTFMTFKSIILDIFEDIQSTDHIATQKH